MSRAAPLLLQCPSFVKKGRRSLIPGKLRRRLLSPSAPPPPPSVSVQQSSTSPSTKLHSRRSINRVNHQCFAAGDAPSEVGGGGGGGGQEEQPSELNSTNSKDQHPKKRSWFGWKMDVAAMRSKLATLGLAAVLAYGLFDGVTYTTFFVLAFLGYEKSTGKNPAANIQALLGIVILMWTGNNITRPFRVAGAAALAPVVDKALKKIQEYFNLPRQVYAFALVVSAVASLCLSVVGLLILSRWGK